MSLTSTEFAFVRDLVRREAAIVLEPGKEYLVEARLLPLARQVGVESVSELVLRLQKRCPSVSQALVVDAMTTNETSWFRDREPFSVLADVVVPQLVAKRHATRTVRVWSAACSSGQEPYTLAMVLEDALPAGWRYEIVGTDISDDMLARAQAGRFSQLEVNRGLPAPLLVRHFDRVGAEWHVSSALRRNVSFRKANLAGPLPSMPPFDVIFLRNVLIYFDLETKRSVLRRMGALIRPDGWLFLGAAETTIGVHDEFERVGVGRTSAYRPPQRTTPPLGSTSREDAACAL